METLFRREGDELIVQMPGHGIDPLWLARPLEELGLSGSSGVTSMRVESSPSWRWHSGDAAFLAGVLRELDRGEQLTTVNGLPRELLHLLVLARTKPALPEHTPRAAPGLIANVGAIALNGARDVRLLLALLGQVVLVLPRFVIGHARVRGAELLEVLADSSSRAVGIVAVVSALMGAILAFVGAVQLTQFGAGIYVADLVGIASVRELVPILTAIVLAGRTGASFAARIATMQGNEEIDALTTLGVSPVEFLVLPRVVALSLLMPLLYVYACAVALLTGAAVAVPLLDIPAAEYIARTQHAIDWPNFALGGLKSLVFGALVALLACHRGLRSGRSAADVGLAATTAVVSSIVMIIALDAVFAVCAHALRI